MGLLTLVEEEWIAASPAAIFDSFASPADGTGWLFGARCDDLVRGAVVRFDLPLSSGWGGLLQGVGRIVEVQRPRRIVLEHESPWRGRLTITVKAMGGQCAELRVSRSTFYYWRQLGKPPKCIKLPNGEIRVRRADLDTWITSREEVA